MSDLEMKDLSTRRDDDETQGKINVSQLNHSSESHAYYNIAMDIESKLKKMNTYLTFLSILNLLSQVIWIIYISASSRCKEDLYVKIFIPMIICYLYLGYKWISLWRTKEASHALNHVSIFLMILIIELSILANSYEKGCADCYYFVLYSFTMNLGMILGTIFSILIYKKYTFRIFNKQLRETYLSPLAFKYLQYLPIHSQEIQPSNPEEAEDSLSQYNGMTTLR
jgi:hypothetical protein